MENALTASSSSTRLDYAAVVLPKLPRKNFAGENINNSAANMPVVSSTQQINIGQIHEGSSFPHKLYGMLEVETAKVESCSCGSVQWEKHGLTFRILDASRFESETIPRYFKHTKYTSFQRQLNLYGFRRISKGEDQGSYFHPKFQRNRKDLLFEIRRLPGKQHGGNTQSSEPLIEPFRRPTLSASENELETKDHVTIMPAESEVAADHPPPPEDCVVEEVQEQLPQYDVEKHLAQYDKEEFMQLVFSVLRDMEAVHAAGQLDNMVLYSQEQQQSDAPTQLLDQVERADGTRTDA